jgi:hypothetical protein
MRAISMVCGVGWRWCSWANLRTASHAAGCVWCPCNVAIQAEAWLTTLASRPVLYTSKLLCHTGIHVGQICKGLCCLVPAWMCLCITPSD